MRVENFRITDVSNLNFKVLVTLVYERFSAVSLCLRANAIHHSKEWVQFHSKGGYLWR